MVKHVGKKVTNNPKGKHLSVVSGNSGQRVAKYNDTGIRYPQDVLEFRRVQLGKYVHPTQKPVALFEYLIKTYTNENDIVLDNCIGSGTTAVACINTNRRFIGIEQSPEYCLIAENRIKQGKNGNAIPTI